MRLLRALSLDVVAGAAGGGLLAEYAANARMPPRWWIALLTAVWSIYTLDHLLDALRARQPLDSYRHAFHQKHAGSVLAALVVATTSGLIAAFGLEPDVRLQGLALSGLVVFYLASAQGFLLPTLPKEPLAGLLYAAGIWSGPILASGRPTAGLFPFAALHALAAILNLAMLGVFEADVDTRLGHRSMALRWSTARVRGSVLAMGAVGTLISLVLAAATLGAGHTSASFVFTILALQIATPASLLLADRYFEKRERYRSWGDSVFLIGGLPRLLGLFS